MQAASKPIIRTVVPFDLLRSLDRLAEHNGLSRSSQVRTILLDALRASADPNGDEAA